MPTLQDFIAKVTTVDWARQARYSVKINFPQGLNITNGTDDDQTISMLCDEAQIPGIFFETKKYHIYGPEYERPAVISYTGDGIRLQFMVTQDFLVRAAFEKWMHAIVDPSDYLFSYPQDYMVSSVVIQQLKHSGPELEGGTDVGSYSVRLIDAFPKVVEPMTLSYGSTQFHRLVVLFAFTRWVPQYGDGDPPMQLLDNTTGADTTPSIPQAPTTILPGELPFGP